MRILKCLSSFKMSRHIKDRVESCESFESCAFVHVGVQECCFLIANFSRKFDRRMVIVHLFNELFYSVPVYSPEREYVFYKTFSNARFQFALAKDFRVYLIHEYIRKGDCHFLPMAMRLKVVIFAKYRSYIWPNKPVQNFAFEQPCYFHLKVKSVMSTLIFLSTGRKKPV